MTTVRDARRFEQLVEDCMPLVGELVRKGKPVFYAFVNGEYVESTSRVAVAVKLADAAEAR